MKLYINNYPPTPTLTHTNAHNCLTHCNLTFTIVGHGEVLEARSSKLEVLEALVQLHDGIVFTPSIRG